MKILNINIEPSAATRRDWRNVQLAWREFVEDTRAHPFVSILCLAIMLFCLVAPWVL